MFNANALKMFEQIHDEEPTSDYKLILNESSKILCKIRISMFNAFVFMFLCFIYLSVFQELKY